MNEKARKLAAYIQKNPDDSFSKFALGLEFLKVSREEKAKVLFESILHNDPGYLGVYYHLGKLYAGSGQIRQARDTYREGIEIGMKQDASRTVSELREALAELEYDLE